MRNSELSRIHLYVITSIFLLFTAAVGCGDDSTSGNSTEAGQESGLTSCSMGDGECWCNALMEGARGCGGEGTLLNNCESFTASDFEQGCTLSLSSEECEPLLNEMLDCFKASCDPEACTHEMTEKVRNHEN